MEKLNILIVEDEAINSLYLKMALEQMGHTVLDITISGEETLKKVFTLEPDLIFMDIYLKGALDGIETVRLIHDSKPFPVVYVTASTDESTYSRAKQTNLSGYITKPFTLDDLEACIKAL